MEIIDNLRFALTLLAALGCGLMAGLFFAFSISVMNALARLTPAQGITAMQAINIAILNPIFLGVFLGTAVASALAIIVSLLRWDTPGAFYLLTGGALYLIGNILVTALFNVPKNNALDAVAPADPGSASLWADYLTSWTTWNHIRTITALAAMAAFALALC